LVVMEACGPSGWIHDLALSLGLKTLVCSTNEAARQWPKVRWIALNNSEPSPSFPLPS
jgi:hypothetical protein